MRRFHQDSTWTGVIKAGGMGPGSPEMLAKGKGTFRWIMDGLWVVGDFEQDQFVGDELAMTWKAHYLAGWDHSVGEYRAYVVDSNGRGSVFKGEIAGDTFTISALEEVNVGGQSFRLRMVWDMHDPERILWFNEGSVDDGPWFLIEEYVAKPTG